MTYEEYKNTEFEGGLAEWVDGEVIVHVPPKDQHQNVVEFLLQVLGLFVQHFWLNMQWMWAADTNPLAGLAQIVGAEQLIRAIQSQTTT